MYLEKHVNAGIMRSLKWDILLKKVCYFSTTEITKQVPKYVLRLWKISVVTNISHSLYVFACVSIVFSIANNESFVLILAYNCLSIYLFTCLWVCPNFFPVSFVLILFYCQQQLIHRHHNSFSPRSYIYIYIHFYGWWCISTQV